MKDIDSQSNNNDSSLTERMLSINLHTYIEQIKTKTPCSKCGKSIIPIINSASMSMLLYAMQTGNVFTTQAIDCILSIQLMEGSLLFNSPTDSIALEQGQMLARHGGTTHQLVTKMDSIFLLTRSHNNTSFLG